MNGSVVSYGLDYVRFKVWTDRDVDFIAKQLSCLDIKSVFYHGSRFVDITGKQLAVARVCHDLSADLRVLSEIFPVSRVDFYFDVLDSRLQHIPIRDGRTVISSGYELETVYSHKLASRGDRAVFGRAYDAKKAGHYDFDVTRFEVEYKSYACASLTAESNWLDTCYLVAAEAIEHMFSYRVLVEGCKGLELNASRKRLEHSRERFYTRYGKGIINDVQSMGLQGLYEFMLECCRNRKEKADETS